MLKLHNYGGDGVCHRCSHDSFSSGSDYCESNPEKILDRVNGMVPNPNYKKPPIIIPDDLDNDG